MLLGEYYRTTLRNPSPEELSDALNSAMAILDQLIARMDPQDAFDHLLIALSSHSDSNFCAALESRISDRFHSLWELDPALVGAAEHALFNANSPATQKALYLAMLQFRRSDRDEFAELPTIAYGALLEAEDGALISTIIGNATNMRRDDAPTVEATIDYALGLGPSYNGENPGVRGVITAYDTELMLLVGRNDVSEEERGAFQESAARDLERAACRPTITKHEFADIVDLLQRLGAEECRLRVLEWARTYGPPKVYEHAAAAAMDD